jgi:hypothetical protein
MGWDGMGIGALDIVVIVLLVYMVWNGYPVGILVERWDVLWHGSGVILHEPLTQYNLFLV